jgi:cytosine/adenosine deaminase-related metal-dependent hydrolase
MSSSQHIRGASVWDGDQFIRRDLTIVSGTIRQVDRHADHTLDLEGMLILPAFINPHDHLELNHYPRTRFRTRYDNAHQWGEDVNAQLQSEPFLSLRSYPLRDRLLIGALKNLLSGALTVIQHGTPHRELFARDFPVRVVRRYGWAHSLHFSTPQQIQRSYQHTPSDACWFIHLAEGTDAVAHSEYQRLSQLGCVQPNTVLIHGIGLDHAALLADANGSKGIRALITCPTTNRYLLGATLPPAFIQQSAIPILIGSDSRLTADGDLLDEVAAWSAITGTDCWQLLASNATTVARTLGIPQSGTLAVGSPADLLIVPAAQRSQSALRRDQISAVIRAGKWMIADPALAARVPFAATTGMLDGAEKRVHNDLAERIRRCTLKESGLTLEPPQTRRFWFGSKR